MNARGATCNQCDAESQFMRARAFRRPAWWCIGGGDFGFHGGDVMRCSMLSYGLLRGDARTGSMLGGQSNLWDAKQNGTTTFTFGSRQT